MDAFISYRRSTGALYADKIYNFLTENQLNVFYDRKKLHTYTGKFPDELKKQIQDADNFILILSDLNIDNYEKSHFINEIKTALECPNINIIVILCNGFTFPETLPDVISELPNYEALTINDITYLKNGFFSDLLAKMIHSDSIIKAYNRLHAFTKLESRKIVESRQSLADRFSGDIISVDVCAMACHGLIEHAREYLCDLLESGCKIRMIMNDPDSDAAAEAARFKISGGSLNMRKRIIPNSYDGLVDWISNHPAQFEGRITDLHLPCSIMIIRHKTPGNSTVKVDYYSFDCADRDRRCVMIHEDDEDNFKFYIKQFEWIWEKSIPVHGEVCEE